ncbi:MAG: type II toxin-antitoxin system RelE/ParE family toxin [Chitinophagales bacterium]|jgi:toxin ParE1/3/4|nr:type II toxin-antitoxin system RelE/ParE family toxin [Chitinophagales bacterium]
MEKISWSDLALEDLQQIYDYICKDSELYASRVTERIVERIEILNTHSTAGTIVPEFEEESIRQLIEGNYRIIYRINSDGSIGIARIHHGARLLKDL